LIAFTGSRRRTRAAGAKLAGVLAAGLLLAGAAPAPAQDGGDSAGSAGTGAPALGALAQCLAKDGRVEVAFREERLVTSVDEMLESTGRLIYEPPERLEKIVEQPRRERAVVEGDRMSVFDAEGNEVATFDLGERPGLKASFDAVRALLKGDAAALEERFQVALAADTGADAPGAWDMRLKPKGDDAGYTLSRIEIDGQGAPGLSAGGGEAPCQVETIDVRLRDGGRRILHLRPGS
jgi:outer membrane lipoprotein-sorting protein